MKVAEYIKNKKQMFIYVMAFIAVAGAIILVKSIFQSYHRTIKRMNMEKNIMLIVPEIRMYNIRQKMNGKTNVGLEGFNYQPADKDATYSIFIDGDTVKVIATTEDDTIRASIINYQVHFLSK